MLRPRFAACSLVFVVCSLLPACSSSEDDNSDSQTPIVPGPATGATPGASSPVPSTSTPETPTQPTMPQPAGTPGPAQTPPPVQTGPMPQPTDPNPSPPAPVDPTPAPTDSAPSATPMPESTGGAGGEPTLPAESAGSGGDDGVGGGVEPAPSQPAGDGNVLFSDDFESGTVGAGPEGWDTFVAWVANGGNPSGETSALISSEQSVSGSQSIHFSGGSNPAQIVWPLPDGTNKVYLTAWVYMTRQLGENPGDNHEHIFAIRGEPGSANNEVRFGEIKGTIGTNEVPSDNITPLMDQWGMGPALPANTWICFEVGFIADQMPHELHAWADGQLVHSITAADQWQNGAMPDNWMDGKFVEAVFGWHSFSSNDIDVWMDDIIISTDRQGCP